MNFRETISDKQRIVFAGSEGCETMSAIVAHVLSCCSKPFALVENNELIRNDPNAAIVLISAPDKAGADGQASFLDYGHHFGVITDIHFRKQEGFVSEDEYIRQFDQFADATPKGGLLAYCEQDPVASVLCNKERTDVGYVPFKAHPHTEENGDSFLVTSHKDKIRIPGPRPDWRWVGGAKELLKKIGITSEQFYQSIAGFRRQ